MREAGTPSYFWIFIKFVIIIRNNTRQTHKKPKRQARHKSNANDANDIAINDTNNECRLHKSVSQQIMKIHVEMKEINESATFKMFHRISKLIDSINSSNHQWVQ